MCGCLLGYLRHGRPHMRLWHCPSALRGRVWAPRYWLLCLQCVCLAHDFLSPRAERERQGVALIERDRALVRHIRWHLATALFFLVNITLLVKCVVSKSIAIAQMALPGTPCSLHGCMLASPMSAGDQEISDSSSACCARYVGDETVHAVRRARLIHRPKSMVL